MHTPQPNTTPPDRPRRSRLSLNFLRLPEGSRWSGPASAALMFTGVVLPIICFLISFPERPEWQSGNLQDYAQLLLAHKPASPLYPFLLYNMTCMTLLVCNPGRFVKSFVVRLGVYTGVLLALQYWLVFVIALGGTGPEELLTVGFYSLLAVVVPWAGGWLIALLFRKFGEVLFILIALLTVLGVILVWALTEAAVGDLLMAMVLIPCLLCLFCAAPWAVASYTVMTIYALRNSGVKRMRFSLAQLLGVLTWLAAYLGAWRTSALLMLQQYAKLPTEQPEGCYVCTAAARGHRRLVGDEYHATASGRVYRVTDQMRYLKAAELLLAGISPPAHRVCRRAYDLIGPPLAAAMGHPLLADAAYLSLKPAEWLCRAGLALLLPGHRELIRKIYRSPRD